MNEGFLIPISKQLKSQGTLILKGAGLGLLKPKFFTIDQRKAAIEDEANQLGGKYGFDKTGFLGLPVWDTMSISSPAYTDDSGKAIPNQTVTLDLALIEVTQQRNIVKTSVAGRNGTVKEYMSNGDYDIRVNGVLSTEFSNIPPSDLIKNFSDVLNRPVTLDITSNFLSYMNIYTVVCDTFNIKQREGTRNVVDIDITFCSDIPFEIQTVTV